MWTFVLCSVFFLNFQLKLQFLLDVWKLHLAVPQTFSLLTFRSNPAQAILSHPSPSSCILPWKSKLSVSIFHPYSVLHTPKSTWRSLLAYPFPFLEMPKQLCIPKTNPVLLKQKHFWSEVDSVEEIHLKSQEAHAGFLPAVALPPVCYNNHTFANTSKKFICNAATCNQSNYLCSFTNWTHSLL